MTDLKTIKREIQAAHVEALASGLDQTVKFKALLPGQRFTTGMHVNMIKLNRTLAAITDAAGNIYSTHTVLPNERVVPAPAMVARPTATSRAAVTLLQGIGQDAHIARMKASLKAREGKA